MTTKTASRLAKLSFPLFHWTSNCLRKMSCFFCPYPWVAWVLYQANYSDGLRWRNWAQHTINDNTGEKKSEWGLFIPCISFIRGSLIFEGHWFNQWGPVKFAIYWFWEPVKCFWECLSLLFFIIFIFNHHGSRLNSNVQVESELE